MKEKTNDSFVEAVMINQQDVPSGFLLCFADKEKCQNSGSCLRRLVASLPLDAGRNPVATVVDPRYVDTLGGGQDCMYYCTSKPMKCKRGMTHMFDDVPARLLKEVRKAVELCFSNRHYYFDAKKGLRSIIPEEQERIAAAFKKLCPGIEPHYDSEEEIIVWHQ